MYYINCIKQRDLIYLDLFKDWILSYLINNFQYLFILLGNFIT